MKAKAEKYSIIEHMPNHGLVIPAVKSRKTRQKPLAVGTAEALHNWSGQTYQSTIQSSAWVADKLITANILFLSVVL